MAGQLHAIVGQPYGDARRGGFWDATGCAASGSKVEFYVGGTLLNTDTSAPYSYYWKPSSKGNQTLTVKAYDDAGAVTTSDPVTVRVK